MRLKWYSYFFGGMIIKIDYYFLCELLPLTKLKERDFRRFFNINHLDQGLSVSVTKKLKNLKKKRFAKRPPLPEEDIVKNGLKMGNRNTVNKPGQK